MNVDFQQDTDKVVEVLRATATSLQDDPTLGPYILEPLEVLGVDGFRDGQVTIRSRIKTQPQRQWDVGREMRRRLRIAFTQAGIDLPPAGLHTVLSPAEAVARHITDRSGQHDAAVFEAACAEVQISGPAPDSMPSGS